VGPWVERNVWNDIPTAIALRMQGHLVVDWQAIDRYLTVPAAPHPGARALDCCTGVGQGAFILGLKGYVVDAFDKWGGSAAFLEENGIRFYHQAFEEFTTPSQYDLICACECLEHVASPVQCLARIDKWLTPGGLLRATIPIEGGHTDNPYHVRGYTEVEARALFAGWKITAEEWYQNYILGLWLRRNRDVVTVH